MTRARNIAGFSTITTTPSPVHVGPIGVLTATRIDGEFNLVDLATRDITAQGIGVTNLQVSGITTGLNVSGIITAQNGINFNGTSTGLNVSGIGTIATLSVTGNATVGGVLTYEDVTRVDSVGVITAREQVHVGTGVSIAAGGLNVTAGISTFVDVSARNLTVSAASTFTGNIKQTASGSSTAKLTLNNASDTTGMDVGYSESSGLGFINVGQSGSGLSIKTGGTAAGNERISITSDGAIEVKGTRSGALQASDSDALQLYTKSTSDDINRGVGITFYNHDGSGTEMGGTIQVAKENGTADDVASYMRFSTRPAGGSVTERVRIHSNGIITVGNDAAGAATYGGQMVIATTSGGVLTCADTGSGERLRLEGGAGLGRIGTDSNHDLVFITNGTSNERLRITSTGELGVNTAAPVEKLGISGNMRFVNPNGTTSRITALPSGSYSTGTSGGSAVCFQRVADSSGGSDEIFFETHWQGNRHAESCRITKQGNLKFPSGQGIDFSATGDGSGSMTSELLDDYEEGTWTPQMHDGNSSNVVLTVLSGRNFYIKIGRLCYISGNVTLNDTGKSGVLTITHLPFNSSDQGQLACGNWWVDLGGPSAGNGDIIGGVCYKTGDDAKIYFVNPTNGASNDSSSAEADTRYWEFSQWTNGRPIYFNLTYQTA